jgi:hypothetical protein
LLLLFLDVKETSPARVRAILAPRHSLWRLQLA